VRSWTQRLAWDPAERGRPERTADHRCLIRWKDRSRWDLSGPWLPAGVHRTLWRSAARSHPSRR